MRTRAHAAESPVQVCTDFNLNEDVHSVGIIVLLGSLLVESSMAEFVQVEAQSCGIQLQFKGAAYSSAMGSRPHTTIVEPLPVR